MINHRETETSVVTETVPMVSRRESRGQSQKGKGTKGSRKDAARAVANVPFIGEETGRRKNELVLAEKQGSTFGSVLKTRVAPVLISLLIVLCGVFGVSTLVFGKDPGTYLGELTVYANDLASNTYRLAMEAKKEDAAANDLMRTASTVSQDDGYAIWVDNVEVVRCASEEDANWVLDTIKKNYPEQNAGAKVTYAFKENVPDPESSGQGSVVSKEEALIKMTNGAAEDASFVHVVRTEVVEMEETIPFITNRKSDNSLYKGTEKVQAEGVNEVKKITITFKYEDGVAVGSPDRKEEVMTPSVTKVILVGTKALPSSSNQGGGGVAGAPNFIWPINARITSPFGQRWGRLHAGLDFGANAGTPIKAAASGTVTQAATGWNGGFGTVVVVKHNSSYSTRYAHMSRLGTSVGKQVSAGEVIGYVGTTGSSTGNHLHFEIRVNGVAKNPIPYLP